MEQERGGREGEHQRVREQAPGDGERVDEQGEEQVEREAEAVVLEEREQREGERQGCVTGGEASEQSVPLVRGATVRRSRMRRGGARGLAQRAEETAR